MKGLGFAIIGAVWAAWFAVLVGLLGGFVALCLYAFKSLIGAL